MNKLTEGEFYGLLCNVYLYFGREKMPIRDRSAILFEKVYHLNADMARRAFERIKDDYENLPPNLPRALRKTVCDINAQDPDKQMIAFIPHKFGRCDDCKGSGMFKLRVTVKDIVYEPIKYCSACENYRHWVNDPGKRISKYGLEKMGMMFKPYTDAVNSKHWKNMVNDKYNPSTAMRDLRKLANNSTKRIEE